MNRLWLLTGVLLLAIGCGGGGGGGGSAAPAPNPAVTPPLAPSGVATTVMSATSIRVTWVDNASNEDGFTVEYLIPPATTFQTAGTVAANVTQFTHTGLLASTNYVYRVLATNTAGPTFSTNQANGTTSAAPVTAPSAPTTLGAQAQSATQINLVWIDNASNEDGFKIERSTSATTGFAQIDTVGANVVVYSATGLTASTQYFFRVRAYNSAVSPNSAYSNETNATTQAAGGGGSGTWVEQTLPALLANHNFASVWGSSANDVFVVGDNRGVNASLGNGIIAHYDGTNWTEQVFTSLNTMYGLLGFSSTNVFAVGLEVSGASNTGSILHYDGMSWTTQKTVTGKMLGAPFVFSAIDIFVVGYGGTILHYDGTNWTAQTSPVTNDLASVWGSSPTNVFAVGGNFFGSTNGVVLRFNGTTWTQQTIPTVERLIHVSGTSSTNVFAVGVNGTILRFDGTTWTQQTSGVTDTLRYVLPLSSANAFAFGASTSSFTGEPGSILQYNGMTWTNAASITEGPIYSSWGSSGTNVFAVGGALGYSISNPSPKGVIYRYNGTTWTKEAQTRRPLYQVWGSSPTDVWAVGLESLILRRQ